MEVYILNIRKQSSLSNYVGLFEHIAPERKERVLKLKRNEDKLRVLFAEILVRVMICKKIKCTNDYIKFEYNEYGKPKLIGFQGVEFNISHSGQFVVVAIDSEKVGVDIEKKQAIDALNIAKTFYTNQEYSYITKQDKVNQTRVFYKIWTLKESYVKFMEKGLSIPINSFTFIKDNDGLIKLHSNDKESGAYFHSYELDEGYFLAICSSSMNSPIKIRYVEVENLINDFMNTIG